RAPHFGGRRGQQQQERQQQYVLPGQSGRLDRLEQGGQRRRSDRPRRHAGRNAAALSAAKAAPLARRQEGGRLLRREVADARRRRDERAGLEFPGRPLSRLRPRRRRRERRAALHRAQRRRRADGGHPAGMAGDRPLDAADRHRERRRGRRQGRTGRRQVDGAAALRARVRGRAMSRFGPALDDTGVTFRLWAPSPRKAELLLDRAIAMEKHGEWFTARVAGAGAGTRYRFRIDGDIEIADPASHFQPEDVQGPSEVVDHAYAWKCKDWTGRPWEEAVISEAHAGTFTREGTFRAIIGKLDHLAATGITALELMPLADFPGRWYWGYAGVLPYAPDSAYGRPEDLKALIDAAHARGLMVFLDVVYNHFGPEGNYLHRIAPKFFSQEHHTPWGAAIDYRVPEVRAFAIDNALHWLRHYRFDGLRLDAVHAIVEPGEPHILADLAAAVDRFAKASRRTIHLVLENDDNAARWLAPAGGYRAQWNDDYHHAWHVLLTHEQSGYYRDYQNAPAQVARSLAQGFSYQGEPSAHREGRRRGEPSAHLPRADFVNFLQNHDQIGNRPMGERLAVLAPPE